MYRAALRIYSIALAALAASAVQAAPNVFFGENLNPNFAVSGAPLAARQNFMSNLTGVGTEGFNAQEPGDTSPLLLNFPAGTGSITALLLGAGAIADASTSPSAQEGHFNTTGAAGTPNAGQYWDSTGAFDITFSKAISAFGFYGTDIGDAGDPLTLTLTDTTGATTRLVVPATQTAPTAPGQSGALLFWGFVDRVKSYTRISFSGSGAVGTDDFGFDDMVIGDKRQILPPTSVPEPGTMALLGLGLAGLAASRRRKKN